MAFAIFLMVNILIVVFGWVSVMLWSNLLPQSLPWRWGQQVSWKRWWARARLYGVTKKATFHVLKRAGNPPCWHETDVFMCRVSSRAVEWHGSSVSLDLGTVWRLCGSFTFKPLYPRRRAPGIYWVGSWMVPTARFVAVEKREICGLSGNRTPCRLPGSLVSKRTAIIGCPVRTFRGVFDAISVPQI